MAVLNEVVQSDIVIARVLLYGGSTLKRRLV